MQARLMLAAMALLQAASLGIRTLQRGAEDTPLLLGLIAASLLAAATCALLPARALAPLASVVRPATSPTRGSARWPFFVLAGALLLTSVFTQQLWWDERGIRLAAAGIASGGVEGLLEQYRVNAWLGPQHPPLVPALYAQVSRLTNDSLISLRLLDATAALGVLVLADRLLTALLGAQRSVPALCLLLASPLFLRLGSAITSDMPALFFVMAALVAMQRLTSRPTDARALCVGLCFGLAVLCRYTAALAIFPLAAMPILWRGPTRPVRHLGLAAATAALLFGAWILFAWQAGLVEAQVEKISRFAGNATASGVFWRSLAEMLASRLPSAIGIYLVPVLLLGLVGARVRSRENGFLLLWAAGIVGVVAVTAPLTRFMLPAFPAIAALMAPGLPQDETERTRVLLLALLLAGITLAYYAQVDLGVPMELLPGTSIDLG